MTPFSNIFRVALLASAVGFAGCSMTPAASTAPTGSAGSVSFNATLSGAAEVPTNTSAGTGWLEAILDKGNNALRWKLSYSGLSGPATMAHFHGPAMPGANAGVVVPLPNAASPAAGETTLTPAQISDLMAGKWYVNVHTAANPGGEIRGQVMVK